MQKYFSEKFSLDVKKIRNGVDTDLFYLKKSIQKVEKTILHVGRLIDLKKM